MLRPGATSYTKVPIMNKFPLLIFIIAFMALAMFLTTRYGAKSSSSSSNKLVVLSRLWSLPHEKDFVINNVIRPFEQEHKCSVDFQTLDDETLLQRIMTQRQVGRVAVDVVIVYVSRMSEWVENGHVADLTESIEPWDDREFATGFSGMTVFEGRTRFLPIGADVYLLCANKKALEYLPDGAKIEDLTWNQLADWARLVAEGEGEGKFAMTGAAQTMLIYQVGCAVLSHGGGFPDLASPGAVSAWNLFVKMRRSFAPAIMTYESVVPPMKRGEAWLAVAHSARVGEIYSSNPAMFAIAPPPRGPAGIGSIAGVSGLAVVEGCPNRELALAFLDYITSPATQLQLARGTSGFIPTVNEAVALLDNEIEDDIMRNAISVIAEGRLAYIPAHGNWGAVKFLYDEAFQKLVLKDGAVDMEYLEDAQRSIKKLAPTY